MFNQEKYININKIDLDDQTYRISCDNNITNIIDSIKKIGLINSCVLKKEKEKYIIVSGYKRIKALKQIGEKQVFAKVIKPEGAKKDIDFLCAKIAIIENSFYRELNTIELLKAVFILNKSLSIKEIALNSLFIFNHNLNMKIIENLLKVHDMDQKIHDLIIDKKLSMNNAVKLHKYESDIINGFINIFQKVRMGQNKQSEIIVNCHEIARRDNINLVDLLTDKRILDIINQDNPDENFKGNLLRSLLGKLRYPEMTKAYENLKTGIKALKIEPEIKLLPPDNFEGEKYSVSFDFRNIKEFEKNVLKLMSIYKNPSFNSLIQ